MSPCRAILLVTKDFDWADLALNHLQTLGCQVRHVPRPSSIWGPSLQEPCHVAIMAHERPTPGLPLLLERWRRAGQSPRVLLLADEPGTAEQMQRIGVHRVLPRRIAWPDFEQTVAELLEEAWQREIERAARAAVDGAVSQAYLPLPAGSSNWPTPAFPDGN
jgi:hypothetical protein